MKTWLRMVIVLVTVGGGFTGFVVTTQFLSAATDRPANLVLGAAFALGYGLVVAAGLLFVHNPRRLWPAVVAVAQQVPFVSSPLVRYRFTSGAHCTVGLVGGNIAAAFRLGSDFEFALLQPHPWGAGVNLFALALFVLLLRALPPATAPAPPTESGT